MGLRGNDTYLFRVPTAADGGEEGGGATEARGVAADVGVCVTVRSHIEVTPSIALLWPLGIFRWYDPPLTT